MSIQAPPTSSCPNAWRERLGDLHRVRTVPVVLADQRVIEAGICAPVLLQIDDFDIKLPAHFRAGSYRMFWGVGVLPCEDDRRMHVTSGPADGHDRIPAGTLEVR